MRIALWVVIALLQAGPRPGGPADPVAGEWRGTLKPAQGVETPFVVSIAKKGDGYAGVTSGLTEASEVPLTKILIDGATVSIAATADSKLGAVTIAGDLQLAGNTLSGPARLSVGLQTFDVAIDLTRRARATVLQRQVEPKIDYFVGRWKFDYTGADVPPLSAGGRSGTIAFTRSGTTNFATGQVDGDLAGKPYRESHAIGVDPATATVVYVEHRADGSELVSLGSWKSPLAITFHTSPVTANGRTYQLRRVISVSSDTAFDLTEEYAVDGAAYRRLGHAHYTKLP
jgi:hypothetical protein